MTLFETNLMIAIIISFLAFASLILLASLIGLIFRKTEQSNMTVTWYLVTTIVSIMVWIFSVYLQLVFVFPENNLHLFVIVSSIGNIIVLVGLISLANFAKLLVQPTIDAKEFVIMGTIFGIVIGIYTGSYFSGLAGNQSMVDTLSLIANIFNAILMVYIIINIHNDLNVLRDENLSQKQEKQVKFVYWSIMIGLIGLIPIIILGVLVNFNFLAIAFIVLPVALFFLNRAYLIDPRVAFILPEKTYLVIMVSNTGVPKYIRNYSFDNNRGPDSTVLISGALNAVSSLMSDFYNTPVEAKQIEFEDQQILLEWTSSYFIAVFSDQDSSLLRSAMKNSIQQINAKYDYRLDEEIAKGEEMDLDEIFDRTFYFIYR